MPTDGRRRLNIEIEPMLDIPNYLSISCGQIRIKEMEISYPHTLKEGIQTGEGGEIWRELRGNLEGDQTSIV